MKTLSSTSSQTRYLMRKTTEREEPDKDPTRFS
jgi:hypothetical protein